MRGLATCLGQPRSIVGTGNALMLTCSAGVSWYAPALGSLCRTSCEEFVRGFGVQVGRGGGYAEAKSHCIEKRVVAFLPGRHTSDQNETKSSSLFFLSSIFVFDQFLFFCTRPSISSDHSGLILQLSLVRFGYCWQCMML